MYYNENRQPLQGGWRYYLSRQFLFIQLEIVFYIFIAILPVLVFSLQIKGRSIVLPEGLFQWDTVIGHASRYSGGIAASVILSALLMAATIIESISRFRLSIIKSSVISIIMAFIIVNFIISGRLVDPAAVDGVLFFSFYCGFMVPVAMMVHLESKRSRSLIKTLLVFLLLLFLAALPQIVRQHNPASSAGKYFMDIAIVYILAFSVIIPYELTKGEDSLFWRFVKFTYLYAGAGIIAGVQQIAYIASSLIIKGLFGLRTAADSGGDLVWLGNMQIAAAPYHVIWCFIRDYVTVKTPQDLFGAFFFLWAVSSLVLAGSPGLTTFRSRWFEITCGAVIIAVMASALFR